MTADDFLQHSRELARIAERLEAEASALTVAAPTVRDRLWPMADQVRQQARIMAYLATDPAEAGS